MRVAGLGQLETLLDRLDYGRQIRPRIEQPDLRFHRERVRAFLHDAGAFAVVLAQHDERAADDARRGEVGKGIGGHIGADRGFPGHGAANRIVDRGGQHGRGGGFACRGLESHTEFAQDDAGIRQHVHQVGNRRALITADVTDARLQQRLGHGQDPFAFELGAFVEAQRLHLFSE